MQRYILLFFELLTITGALMVVTAKNPVKAVLSLIFTFVSCSIVWLMLHAEFLSVTLILVYVGAVTVLFLFVVMMLDIKSATLKSSLIKFYPLVMLVPIALVFSLVQGLAPFKLDVNEAPLPPGVIYNLDYSNVKAIGEILFTDYLFHFEVAGIILLSAMVAAIALVFAGPRKRLTQNAFTQISTEPQDRLKLIKGMQP